ncbi:MAG: hypothetical protein SNJ75_05090 [Gemmataceae bacterium]
MMLLSLVLSLGCARSPQVETPPTVYYFVGIDCPIANAYAPEIARIQADYPAFRHVVVYPLPDATADQIARHAKEFGLGSDARHDRDLHEARRLGVTRTPEVVVVDSQGKTVYQGRIDDRYPRPGGRRREHPTRHDLRQALDDLLNGQAVRVPRTEAVGCDIDFDSKVLP